MSLDLKNLRSETITINNSVNFHFVRDLKLKDESRVCINYQFGFPRINPRRFAKVDFYSSESKWLPETVRDYFLTFNDSQTYAYISQFYPHGMPSKRNAFTIKERENKGLGSQCFDLILSNLQDFQVNNVFINPENDRMSRFIEKRGFVRIPEPKIENFAFSLPTYGLVLK